MKTPSLRIWRTDDGKVAMACPLPDASMQYTTDDSDPVAEGVAYTAPLSVAVGTIVRAVATATGYDPSDEARLEVAGLPVLPAPTLSEGATHGSGTVVTVDVEILNAGSYPAGATAWGKYGNVYFSGRKLSELTESVVCTAPSGETVSVMIKCPGYTDSAMSDITVTAPKVATPTFSYNKYTGQLTISCATSGATIYYRIGASGSYQQYSAALTITEDVTVYAYAQHSGYTQSNTGKIVCDYVGYPAEGSTLPDPEITITYSGNNARIYWDNWSDYDGYLANPDANVALEVNYSSAGYVVASSYLSLPLDEISSPIFFRASDTSGHYEHSNVISKQTKIQTPSLSLTRNGTSVTAVASSLISGMTYCYKIGSAPSSLNDGAGSFTASSDTYTFTYSSDTSGGAFTMYLRGFKTRYDPSDSTSAYISALYIPTPSFTLSVEEREDGKVKLSGTFSNIDDYPGGTENFSLSAYDSTRGEDLTLVGSIIRSSGDITCTFSYPNAGGSIRVTLTADFAGVVKDSSRTLSVPEYKGALPAPELSIVQNEAIMFAVRLDNYEAYPDYGNVYFRYPGSDEYQGKPVSTLHEYDGIIFYIISEDPTMLVHLEAEGWTDSTEASITLNALPFPNVEIESHAPASGFFSASFNGYISNYSEFPAGTSFDVEIWNDTTGERIDDLLSVVRSDGSWTMGSTVFGVSLGDTLRVKITASLSGYNSAWGTASAEAEERLPAPVADLSFSKLNSTDYLYTLTASDGITSKYNNATLHLTIINKSDNDYELYDDTLDFSDEPSITTEKLQTAFDAIALTQVGHSGHLIQEGDTVRVSWEFRQNGYSPSISYIEKECLPVFPAPVFDWNYISYTNIAVIRLKWDDFSSTPDGFHCSIVSNSIADSLNNTGSPTYSNGALYFTSSVPFAVADQSIGGHDTEDFIGQTFTFEFGATGYESRTFTGTLNESNRVQ